MGAPRTLAPNIFLYHHMLTSMDVGPTFNDDDQAVTTRSKHKP